MKQLLILLTMFLAQAAPSQQTQQGQASPATGSIEGTVNKFGTTDGVSKAKVTLTIVQGPGTAQAVTADSEGKFAFRNLPQGQYRINASRDGYVSADYGQRGPNGTGVPITVNPPQPVRDIRIGLTSTGAISGRVTNRDGEPVGNANVQAMRYTYQDGRRSLTVIQTIRTNDLGEYRLFWMAPGQYIVSAEPVVPLAIEAGGTFFVQAPRGGGGPAALAGALGAQLGVGGVTRITITGGGGPGGPGGPPGPGGPGGAAPPPPPPPPPVAVDNPETYLPVYYPGTTDATAATAIDLRAGGTVQGVNMTVVEVHPARIRGQVTNSGRPASGAQVSLYARSSADGNVTIRGTTVSDTGTFEFRSVAPGAYELAATMNAAGPTALILGGPLGNAAGFTTANIGGRGRTAGQPMMATRAPVDVNNSDINGLSLVLEPAFNVNGRVSIEGRTINDSDSVLTGIRIQLQSDPLIPPLAISPANPEGNGTFAISGAAPGTYRITLAGLPRNTYVKSAQIGGVDVMNDGLRLDREPGGQLDIVLGSTPGTLDVTALDDRLMPVSGVTVVLIPDAAQQKRYDLYRNANSDASGKLHLDGVAPGNYKVFAWEDIENSAWTDAEFMRSYEGRGTTVRIGDGSRSTVEAKVIPYKVN